MGDELMAAGHARVEAQRLGHPVAIVDDTWTPRWHELWHANPSIVKPEDVTPDTPVIRNAKRCRPYIQYPFTRDTGWRYTTWRARDHRGELFFTPQEIAFATAMQRQFSRPFVYLEPSISPDTTRNKEWAFEKWQAVVDACPDLQFVRGIHDDPRELVGPNVFQFRDSNYRQVAALLALARAYVGYEGGLTHAAAAVACPAVSLVGAAISVEHLGYPEHFNIADSGSDSPCGSWKPCAHCRAFMDSVDTALVVDTLRECLHRGRMHVATHRTSHG